MKLYIRPLFSNRKRPYFFAISINEKCDGVLFHAMIAHNVMITPPAPDLSLFHQTDHQTTDLISTQ
ncbi:hypothetical protein ACVW2L_003031 [Mucilaginibacter sp. HD30]